MFNFSCADFTFPVLDRKSALCIVKLLGFDYVDIGIFARSSHFSPYDLHRSPKSYAEQISNDLRASELLPSDVFLQTGVDPSEFATNDPSPLVQAKNRDIFMRCLDLCTSLGCRHLTGLPGVYHKDNAPERDWSLAREVTAWRLAECSKVGVCYSIEPHVGSIVPDTSSTKALLTSIDNLTITLDYGHFVMAGEDSNEVHDLLPSASHVHVRGGAPGYLQVPMEENAIDFEGMLCALNRRKFEGFLALEYVWVNWKGCNRTDNVSETILLHRSLNSSISEIKKRRDKPEF